MFWIGAFAFVAGISKVLTHLCCFVDRAMVTAPDYEEMSWELSVQIDQKSGDEFMKFKLRVKGDLHIGGLMLKLVEKISKCLRLLWFECALWSLITGVSIRADIQCNVALLDIEFAVAAYWTN